MSLEKIISSKIRRKIIRVLSKLSETNIMDLVRRANSTYNQIIPHLTLLEKEGIISEQRYGRVRIIKLELNNEKTQTLLKALKILCDEQKPTKILPNSPSSKNDNIASV